MRSNNLRTAKLKQNRYLEIHDIPYREPRAESTLPPPTAITRMLNDQDAQRPDLQAEVTRLQAAVEALERVVQNRN